MLPKDTCTTTTVTTYKHKLNTALRLFGETSCDDITTSKAQVFFDGLGNKYKSKTIRGLYDTVNAAFRLAVSQGLINSNPFQNVSVGKVT